MKLRTLIVFGLIVVLVPLFSLPQIMQDVILVATGGTFLLVLMYAWHQTSRREARARRAEEAASLASESEQPISEVQPIPTSRSFERASLTTFQ